MKVWRNESECGEKQKRMQCMKKRMRRMSNLRKNSDKDEKLV